jgi:hypothetical protein
MISLHINAEVRTGEIMTETQVCGEHLLSWRSQPTFHTPPQPQHPFQFKVQVAEDEWLIEAGKRVFSLPS